MNHPLHPAIVHFPIACWSLATAADVASLWLGEPAWMAAGGLMLVGLVMAIVAMAAGVVELLKVDDTHPGAKDLNIHAFLASAAWCLYATSFVLRLHGHSLAQPGPAPLALSVCGFVVLGATGWLGGKLVYQHGVGVRK